MSDLATLYERMFDLNVRIEEMWPFPVTPAPERLVEVIADKLDDDDPKLPRLPEPLRPYFLRLSEDEKQELFGGGWRATDTIDDFAGWMFREGKFGFLAVIAVPVFTPSKTGGASFSWGYYWTELLFGTSVEDLFTQACEWAEQRHAEDMKKVAA